MSSPATSAQRAEVLKTILNDATEDDLTAYIRAIQERRGILARLAAAAVTTGVDVRIINIKPRYLDGMTGTVTDVPPVTRRGGTQCVTILLDEDSTQLYQAQRKSLTPDKRVQVEGVPITCCRPLTASGESL